MAGISASYPLKSLFTEWSWMTVDYWRNANKQLHHAFVKYTIYCKSFEVEKFCGFHGSVGKHETFTIKHFHFDNRALKMAGHSPGSSLKEFLQFTFRPGKVSEIISPSQNYGIDPMAPTCLIKLLSNTMLKWHVAHYFIPFAYS